MTDLTETYFQFVEDRHRIWVKRQQSLPQPWTVDPILQSKKFTNVFRVLDHGSQFVIKELLYSESDIDFGDALMRCFLYRYTNIPGPWEYFHNRMGYYPRQGDLESGALRYVWGDYKAAGKPIFGTAFKMFVGAENKGTDRLTWILNLTERYFHPDSPDYIVPSFQNRWSMRKRLDLLRTIPRCADFMAMQIVSDIGWSPWVKGDENEFVLPGPGCRRGAALLMPGQDPSFVVTWARQTMIDQHNCPVLLTPTRHARYPSLMDVQNTLCEFSKYVRYRNNDITGSDESLTRNKGPYTPKHPGPQPKPFIPPHW